MMKTKEYLSTGVIMALSLMTLAVGIQASMMVAHYIPDNFLLIFG